MKKINIIVVIFFTFVISAPILYIMILVIFPRPNPNYYVIMQDTLQGTNTHFNFNSLSNKIYTTLPKKNLSFSDSQIEEIINNNLLSNLSKIIPLILAVFSGVFGLFTFLTQLNLSKSETLYNNFNSTINDLPNRFDNYDQKVNKIINEIQNDKNRIIEDFQNNTIKIFNETKIKWEELRSLPQIIEKQLNENKSISFVNSLRTFSILNEFILPEYKTRLSNITDILKLWTPDEAQIAAFNLGARGDKICVIYLQKSLEFYEENPNIINGKQIISDIRKAIELLEIRFN